MMYKDSIKDRLSGWVEQWKAKPTVKSMTLATKDTNIPKGDSTQLTLTGTYTDGTKADLAGLVTSGAIKVTSSNSLAVAVDSSLTAKAVGSATS